MRVGEKYLALTIIAAVSLGPVSAGGDSAIEQAVKKELKRLYRFPPFQSGGKLLPAGVMGEPPRG